MNEHQPSSDIDYFAIAKYLWIVVGAVFTWVFKEHVAEDKARASQLAEVRMTYATRDDISELHRKIDDNHREVMRVLTRD